MRRYFTVLFCCLGLSLIPASVVLGQVDGGPKTISAPLQRGNTASRYLRPSEPGDRYKDSVIVFVHGFLGDSDSTWRYSPSVYWPELLVQDAVFQNFDIYVAEYPARLFGSSMTLDDIVNNLNNRLIGDDVFSKHRRVIFVCHSLGGIIVQRLLLIHRKYAKQVPFIYFFATPQTGAQVARLANLFSDNPILRTLSPGDQNQQLQSLEDDWNAAKFAIHRYCAYEKKEYKGIIVVDRLSATRNCTDPVAINENHVTIVKPSGPNHDSYIALKNVIQQLAGESTQLSALQISQAADAIRKNPFDAEYILTELAVRLGVSKTALAAQIAHWADSQSEPFYKKCLALLVLGQSMTAGRCYEEIVPETQRQAVEELLPAAWSAYVAGRYPDSQKLLDQALALQPEDLRLLNADGVVLTRQEKYKEATEQYERAIALETKAGEPNGLESAMTMGDFAVLQQTLGHCQSAELFDDWALLIHRRLAGSRTPDLAIEFNTLAVLYASYGLFADAEQYAEHSSKLWSLALPESEMTRRVKAKLLANQADIYVQMHDHKDAERLYQQAYAIVENVPQFEFPEKAGILGGMANLYFEEGRSDLAKLYSERAEGIGERAAPDSVETAAALITLARIAYDQREYKQATDLSKHAAQIVTKNPGSEYRLAGALDVLIQSLHALGEELEASEWADRLAKIRSVREGSGCEILFVRRPQN